MLKALCFALATLSVQTSAKERKLLADEAGQLTELQSVRTPIGNYLSKVDGSDDVISVEEETKQWTVDAEGRLIHKNGQNLYAAEEEPLAHLFRLRNNDDSDRNCVMRAMNGDLFIQQERRKITFNAFAIITREDSQEMMYGLEHEAERQLFSDGLEFCRHQELVKKAKFEDIFRQLQQRAAEILKAEADNDQEQIQINGALTDI